MKENNKEIVTKIIEDLENTVGLNWPIDKAAKALLIVNIANKADSVNIITVVFINFPPF